VEKGVCVGTLCLLDTRPRELTTGEHQLLRDLGQLVAQELKGG
jgi:GAF domain-containing protein